mmetsp:Transcript_2339/g.9182  ORF Transcript_2339/g.9182 Transcript_2339/m.9182 type:complete len:82 (+) Transcript_2339:120-365(+)
MPALVSAIEALEAAHQFLASCDPRQGSGCSGASTFLQHPCGGSAPRIAEPLALLAGLRAWELGFWRGALRPGISLSPWTSD